MYKYVALRLRRLVSLIMINFEGVCYETIINIFVCVLIVCYWVHDIVMQAGTSAHIGA
jgi:hypothetical protein